MRDLRPTLAERTEALRIGANVLLACWPLQQARCVVHVGPNLLEANAAWQIFERSVCAIVTARYSGELIARSQPGLPDELDERNS